MPNPNCHVVTDMLHRQYNERDLSAVDDYIAEDHIDHNPMPGQEHGRAGVKKLIADVLEHGEVKAEIHESFGDGDLVSTRYTITMTYNGDFMGFPMAGKTTSIHICEIDRVKDGKIVESWGESNALAVLQEIAGQQGAGAHA